MTTRDEFRKSVVARLASRAGHCCSNPDCRRPTSGPEATADGAVNIGVAAHISAAASGGPRFDPQLTPDQRSAATNGIWLCQSCAKLIDSDETRFMPTLLLGWKASAESRAQSYLQTPERPQGADEPILVLPSTDPTVSWLPFSARATTFVGRDAERAQLSTFLESGGKVSWWLLTGAAGTGKSRLALELCRDARPGWNAGFLSRTDAFTGWSHFRPSRPTLVIIDYVSSRAAYVSAVVLHLARSADYLPNPVRVLLLERDQGSWWPRFLRAAVARAELYLGNIFLFSEHDHARAAAQFDVAIARAGTGTEIEAAAINNRGTLHDAVQDKDKALADWSDVIAKGGISDEARACSLNNRADILARRGAHEAAIRDRSEVLALRETSPDRRYIALIRRSHSYLELGRNEDALRDIEGILSTEDISPEQKSEARMTRAALLKDLGRLVEARNDLEAVLASEELFPGAAPSALVELGELTRLEHEADRARQYLEMASVSSDIDASTLVEALIVHARLLTDEGDAVGAESIWQSILTNPNASVRQKSIAASRGAASTSTSPHGEA